MTVSDQIIQVLDALCEKFGLAIDWTSANVVPYLTTLGAKLVSFEIWSSVVWIAVAVVMLVAGIIFAVVTYKHWGDLDGLEVLTGTGAIIFTFVGVAVICVQVFDIIKCMTFPELYIFEYIQRMLDSGR